MKQGRADMYVSNIRDETDLCPNAMNENSVTMRAVTTGRPGPEISFFCPAYLDEANVSRVVRRGVSTLKRVARKYEWIIVEDGSPDGTAGAADKLVAEIPGVSVEHHPRNMGHGRALKTGISKAALEWVGFCDGDDQYDPRDISLMLPHFNDADIIIGKRNPYPNGFKRKLYSAALNVMLRLLFDVPYRDLGCGFKIFRGDILPEITAKSNGIFVQCEMVIRGHKAGLRVAEVEIPAYPRTSGASSSLGAANVFTALKEMLSLWREFYLK